MVRFRFVIAVVVVALLVASAAAAIAAAATFDGATAASGGALPAPRGAFSTPGGAFPAPALPAPGGAFPAPRATSPKARANRRAARRDAASLLAKLHLPGGATRVPSEPADDNDYLRPSPWLEADFASETAHAWWTVPGDPASVIGAVEADPPAGARQGATQMTGNDQTGTSAVTLEYGWQPVGNVLGTRLLAVTFTRIGRGLTGVLAESQSVWIVPRSVSERIPAATRVVQIASTVPGAPHGGSVTITNPAHVRSIVALLNALPVAQPVEINCPAEMDPKTITMTFRASTSGGALAVLRFVDDAPWHPAYSDACAGVSLSIGGRRRAALDGGDFIERIEGIIGFTIT